MQTFVFDPEEDITINELALVVKMMMGHGGESAVNMHEDSVPEFIEKIGVSIRHFKEQPNER